MSRPFVLIINVLLSFCHVKTWSFSSFTNQITILGHLLWNEQVQVMFVLDLEGFTMSKSTRPSYFRSCTLIELNPVLMHKLMHILIPILQYHIGSIGSCIYWIYFDQKSLRVEIFEDPPNIVVKSSNIGNA